MVALPTWKSQIDLTSDLEGGAFGLQILASPNGTFAAFWSADGKFLMRTFKADGISTSAEVDVTPPVSGPKAINSVVGLNNGDFVMSWTDYSGRDNDGVSGVWAQILSPAGETIGSNIHLNLNKDGYQKDASIAALPSGGFAVAYVDEFMGLVRTRAFDSQGIRIGDNVDDRSVSATYGGQRTDPAVIALNGGRYAVLFEDNHKGPDDFGRTIRGRLFKADGTPETGENFPVLDPSAATGKTAFAAAALANGKFAVAWSADPVKPGDMAYVIKAQIFNPDGSKSGGELLMNEGGMASQSDACIVALKDGGFVIGYKSDGDSEAARLATFNASGEFVSNTSITLPAHHSLTNISLSVLEDGRLLAAWGHQLNSWIEGDAAAHQAMIHAQFFDPRDKAVILNGTGQDDQYFGTAFHDRLSGLGGQDRLFGEGGDDVLHGGPGNDRLDGGAGTDTAVFSGRKAEYSIVKNAGGTITISDLQGGRDGSDVLSDIKFAQFSDQIFDLSSDPVAPKPLDPAPLDPTQPSPQPLIRGGGKGRDVLNGGAGNDKLSGGYGNDKLTGEGGQDIFVFNTKLGSSKTDRKVNFDTVTDFSVADDTLWLDNKVFTKLGKGSEASPGQLNGKFFKIGKAKDKNDYVLYDRKTGILSYDADGSGSKYKPVEFAKLSKNLKLTYHDFGIV